MLRVLLYLVLLVLLVRAMTRLWKGMVEGASGQPPRSTGVSPSGVRMVRDPMCGTFVVPSRAVELVVGREAIYFCSSSCRDKYRERTA